MARDLENLKVIKQSQHVYEREIMFDNYVEFY